MLPFKICKFIKHNGDEKIVFQISSQNKQGCFTETEQ